MIRMHFYRHITLISTLSYKNVKKNNVSGALTKRRKRLFALRCISIGKNKSGKYFVRLIYFLILQLTRNTTAPHEQKSFIYIRIPGQMLPC